LNQASRDLAIDQEEKALLDLKRVCERVDANLAGLENLIQELARCIETAKSVSGSNAAAVSYLVDLTQGLELHVLKACRSVISRGRAHVILLGEKKYSDLVPDVSTVRARRKESR